MTPAQVSLSAFRNTVFSETYSFAIDSLPVDISGYTLRMQVRDYAGAPDPPLLTLETVGTDYTQGIYLLSTAQGLFGIRIEQATLAAMPSLVPAPLPSVFAFDVTLASPESDILGPVMQGSFTLNEGVTL